MNGERVRITFRKTAAVRYVSHLDMMRAFKRALRRSELPIVYTEGFNVHPVMIFTPPLSVGFMSECELLDIGLTEQVPQKELLKRLCSALPSGFMAVSVSVPVSKISDMAFSVYRAESPVFAEMSGEVRAFLSKDTVEICRSSKGGDKKVDAAPFLKDARLDGGILTLTLPSGNDLTVNPRLVTDAMLESLQVTAQVDFTRTAILGKDKTPLK